MTADFLARLNTLAAGRTLPPHQYLAELTERCITALEREDATYRPYAAATGKPGGLLDFTAARLPLVIVPDIHARAYFLANILAFTPQDGFFPNERRTILQALQEDAVRVICVGDILHSELRGSQRWKAALEEWGYGNPCGQAMEREMAEGLSALCLLMECKCAFPAAFHCLKGNHENIMNAIGGGDFPFRKFADEGRMTRQFMEEKYGRDVLAQISQFERNLPLAAVFANGMASHAEPRQKFTRAELIDGMGDERVVSALTWTRNGDAPLGSVAGTLNALTGRMDWERLAYFGGHRPVSGRYALRQDGLFVQLHNPMQQNIALVHPDRPFNPDSDIVGVQEKL